MRKLALLHTVPSVLASFPALVRESVGEVDIYNTFDDYLVIDTNRNNGTFGQVNVERLYSLMRVLEKTDADLLLASCSSLTPALEGMRWMFSKPLVCIDGEMLRQTVAGGPRVLVVASNASASNASGRSLELVSAREGKKLDVEFVVVDAAFKALLAGDREGHDRLIVEAVAGTRDKDTIMLAQASIAHLQDRVAEATGIRTLSSPGLCMEELRRVMGEMG